MSDEEIPLRPVLDTEIEDERKQAERKLDHARRLLELEEIRADAANREDLEFRDFRLQLGIRHLLVLTAFIAVSCMAYTQMGIELAVPTFVIALLGAGYFYVADWQQQFDQQIARREKQWRAKYSKEANIADSRDNSRVK